MPMASGILILLIGQEGEKSFHSLYGPGNRIFPFFPSSFRLLCGQCGSTAGPTQPSQGDSVSPADLGFDEAAHISSHLLRECRIQIGCLICAESRQKHGFLQKGQASVKRGSYLHTRLSLESGKQLPSPNARGQCPRKHKCRKMSELLDGVTCVTSGLPQKRETSPASRVVARQPLPSTYYVPGRHREP